MAAAAHTHCRTPSRMRGRFVFLPCKVTSNWFLMSVNSSCRCSSAWLTASSGVLLPSVCTCNVQRNAYECNCW